MSGGVAVDFSALSKAGTSLAEGLERQRTSSLLQALGGQVQAGDYAGAAKTAFDAGDLQTGLSLVKLGESKAQAADFQKGFGGGLASIYGGQTDAVTGTPATVAPTRAPSFTDASGPAGSYLAVLRGKESGGNATARNPNSTATGIDQFTQGTWDGLRAKYPELGLTANGRTDPAQSTRAMEKFTADNARALTSAGVPITPGNLYVSHFLGEAGGPRFIRGVMQNPDAPATAYVTPGAAAANRTVFYNRDGSPKTAGQVYAERTSKFGGASTRVSGMNPDAPAARTQVASADPTFMPQIGGARAGVAPPVAAPTPALTPPDATAGAGSTMTLPAEADPVQPEQRVQIAQAAPQVLQQSGLKPAAAAQMQQMQPGSAQRIQFLVRAMSHPGAPEGGKEAAKALLANELQLDRENKQMTSEQKEYAWDVANGFKGDPMAWRAAKAAATRAPETGPVDVQKYEYAKKQGYAGTLVDFLKTEAEARSTKISNTVTNKGDTAEEVELSKARVSDSGTYQAAGQAAAARLPDIETLRTLSRNLGVQGVEASIKEGLAPYAQALGVKLDGVGDIQAYSGIISKLTPNMRPPGSGATSDFEQKMYAKALPGLLQLPDARELVFDMMQAQAQGEVQRGDIATRYRNGEIDKSQYAKELRAVPNPLDMFRKFREANPTLAEDAIKRSQEPGRPLPRGQREASTSGALKAAPPEELALARQAIASGRPAEKVMEQMRRRGFLSDGL